MIYWLLIKIILPHFRTETFEKLRSISKKSNLKRIHLKRQQIISQYLLKFNNSDVKLKRLFLLKWKQYNQIQKCDEAAITIQKYERGRQVRAKLAEEKEQKDEAATKIQANYRGYRERKRLAEEKAAAEAAAAAAAEEVSTPKSGKTKKKGGGLFGKKKNKGGSTSTA